MKILHLLNLYKDRFLTTWALREIHPLHPDVPMIVLYKHWVDEQLEKAWIATH